MWDMHGSLCFLMQVIRVTMEDDMDNFIFCLAQKKSATKLHKDMNDLVSSMILFLICKLFMHPRSTIMSSLTEV